MDTINNAANYVADTVKGAASTGSKEANKQVAKDGNADVSTRLSAGKDAIGDKVDEKKHNTSADVHKEATKH
ncbi:Glucose-repressible protein [Pestalotiopsis sp. 9143b]|nr:Glucose-repressible protein [Pestalotiopsis sp. 9143b]